jgi:hypothetical protein
MVWIVKVNVSGSLKIVFASSKETPCFDRLDAAFELAHSKSMIRL